MRRQAGNSCLELGKIYAAKGENEKAGAEFEKAIDLYRSLEMIFWLPESEAIFGEVSGIVTKP